MYTTTLQYPANQPVLCPYWLKVHGWPQLPFSIFDNFSDHLPPAIYTISSAMVCAYVCQNSLLTIVLRGL